MGNKIVVVRGVSKIEAEFTKSKLFIKKIPNVSCVDNNNGTFDVIIAKNDFKPLEDILDQIMIDGYKNAVIE